MANTRSRIFSCGMMPITISFFIAATPIERDLHLRKNHRAIAARPGIHKARPYRMHVDVYGRRRECVLRTYTSWVALPHAHCHIPVSAARRARVTSKNNECHAGLSRKVLLAELRV